MLKKIWNHKWFPRVFYTKPDGGKDSGVTAYFLIEWKPVFSIGLLKFNEGSREKFHNHAFNGITWWLKGRVRERVRFIQEPQDDWNVYQEEWKPSIIPKFTSRNRMHQVIAWEDTWALTLRGPWSNTWEEWLQKTNTTTTLTHGRKVVG